MCICVNICRFQVFRNHATQYVHSKYQGATLISTWHNELSMAVTRDHNTTKVSSIHNESLKDIKVFSNSLVVFYDQ